MQQTDNLKDQLNLSDDEGLDYKSNKSQDSSPKIKKEQKSINVNQESTIDQTLKVDDSDEIIINSIPSKSREINDDEPKFYSSQDEDEEQKKDEEQNYSEQEKEVQEQLLLGQYSKISMLQDKKIQQLQKQLEQAKEKQQAQPTKKKVKSSVKIYHCHTVIKLKERSISIAGPIPLSFLLPKSKNLFEEFVQCYEDLGYTVLCKYIDNEPRINYIETVYYPPSKQIQSDLLNNSRRNLFINLKNYNSLYNLSHVNAITLNPETVKKYFEIDMSFLLDYLNE